MLSKLPVLRFTVTLSFLYGGFVKVELMVTVFDFDVPNTPRAYHFIFHLVAHLSFYRERAINAL